MLGNNTIFCQITAFKTSLVSNKLQTHLQFEWGYRGHNQSGNSSPLVHLSFLATEIQSSPGSAHTTLASVCVDIAADMSTWKESSLIMSGIGHVYLRPDGLQPRRSQIDTYVALSLLSRVLQRQKSLQKMCVWSGLLSRFLPKWLQTRERLILVVK